MTLDDVCDGGLMTAQEVRDAMALALSGGVTPSAGSLDAKAEAGGVSVTVAPIASVVDSGLLLNSDFSLSQFGAFAAPGGGPISWGIVDSNGDPIDMQGRDLAFVAYLPGSSVQEFEITAGFTITGDDYNVVNLESDDTNTQVAGEFSYKIWDKSSKTPVATGTLTIEADAIYTA